MLAMMKDQKDDFLRRGMMDSVFGGLVVTGVRRGRM